MIEVAPLAFMRGRTLNDSFVILDEAQNTTPEQMKMFLTRLGFGSKMVVTGDVTQIDLPANQTLRAGRRRRDPRRGRDIRFVRFGGEDVVRHELVQRIVAAYGEHSERVDERSRVLTLPEGLDLDDVPERFRRRSRRDARGRRGRGRPPRGRARRRGADQRAQPRTPRQGRADRRALVPDRRDRASPPGRASSATSSSAPSTPPT